jgi:hypothetical protein
MGWLAPSSLDGESAKRVSWIDVLDRLMVNMRPEVALRDCLEKLFDFLRRTLDLELNSAIWQVGYPTRDIKSLSDLLNRKTETDSLHSTLKDSAFSGDRFHV